MKALDLSRTYFMNTVLPALQQEFPELMSGMAAGLVGNGSECFGYDDELSRDHDWGADYFLWLPEKDREWIPQVAAFKRYLYVDCPPEQVRTRSDYGADIGVMTCGDFYKQLIGFAEGPDDIRQWRMIPEENLAMAVNGQVFLDGDGTFLRTRQKLLRFYPEDLRLKKMAAKCMAIAQTGQYNFRRMAQREDWVTVQTVLSRFTDNVIGLVFLLNRTYRPYYKWAFRRMSELPVLGSEIGELLRDLTQQNGFAPDALASRQKIIEEICCKLAGELAWQGLVYTDDWFFTTHGEQLQSRIRDESLRRLPAQYE